MGNMRWLAALGFVAAFCCGHSALALEGDFEADPQSGDGDADSARIEEYRTADTETRIRLTPYFGYLLNGDKLDLSDAPIAGAEIALEPAELLTVFVELGVAIGMDREREFTDGNRFFKTEGNAVHAAVYVGLFNPELDFGAVRFVNGIGMGTFALIGYDNTIDDPNNPGTDLKLVSEDAFVIHASLFTQLELNIDENVYLSAGVKVHFPIYAKGASVGELIDGEFGFAGVMVQPAIYAGVRF